MSTATAKAKTRLVRIRRRRIESVRPSPENERLYRPIDPNDPEIAALADSIRQYGIQEPLVITADNWLLSGHRRLVAARLAGVETVPILLDPIQRNGNRDKFIELLREHNRHRVKTRDEQLREEIVSINPEETYQALIDYRQAQASVSSETIEIRGKKHRAEISDAKWPMLKAVLAILEERRRHHLLPVSVRKIHYLLLNDPPLKHATKPASTYENTRQSYQDLDDLLVRARLAGRVSWKAIIDDTRPVIVWQVASDVQTFLRSELDGFLKNYWRNLLQSQPNHIEILGEKNTIMPDIRPVAARYCIPMTLGRGYSSLPPRHDMAKRFRESGKERLIVLMITDHDPDGEAIAHSFARSMRDDFEIEEIEPIKVALTGDQVADFELPPRVKAKRGSANYNRFVREYGHDVFEVEALPTADLQTLLTEAIDSVIDVEAFNHEIDEEKTDAVFLDKKRRQIVGLLGDID